MSVIPTITFAQASRNPVLWFCMVLCIAIGFVVNYATGFIDKKDDDCEQRIVKLENDLVLARKDKDDLTTALLIKNGVINEVKKATDSVVREKVGNDAKKIVN